MSYLENGGGLKDDYLSRGPEGNCRNSKTLLLTLAKVPNLRKGVNDKLTLRPGSAFLHAKQFSEFRQTFWILPAECPGFLFDLFDGFLLA